MAWDSAHVVHGGYVYRQSVVCLVDPGHGDAATALFVFFVTVSGVQLLNIRAPLCGLVFSYAVTPMLDRAGTDPAVPSQ